MNKSGVRPGQQGGRFQEGPPVPRITKASGAERSTAGPVSTRRTLASRTLARAVWAGVLSLGLGASVWMIGGCAPDTAVFDPRTFGRSHVANSGEFLGRGPQTRPALPTTLEASPTDKPPAGPVPPDAPIVRLTLQEIIQRAARHNLEARVAGYEPAIEETREVEADARFDPAFFLNGSYEIQRLLSPAGGIAPDPFAPREFRTLSGQVGIRHLLPTGAQAEYSYRVQQIQSNTNFNEADPDGGFKTYYLDELQLRLTQPLLRDFGTEVNRARITISRNNRRVSLLEFRTTLERQLFETERTYWQLVQAEREVAIQQDLLDRSLETYQILRNRYEANLDVSRIQVSQAQTFVAAQRAVLTRATSRVRTLSDQLKRLMNDPDFPAAGTLTILPADSPIVDPIDFQLPELIDAALQFRAELGQQILRIRTAEITQEVARNNLLPQLNFTGSLTLQGAGLNVGQAAKDQRQWEDISSSIGLELEVPIGNRAARAIYRRVELQRFQAIDQFHSLADTVQVEVKTALREVNTAWEEIVQRRASRFAAQDTLLGIQQRVEADEPLTPEFVQLQLDAQERLARAAAEEAAAIALYNTAIAQLEQAKGTLLRYNNVVMAEEPLPNPPQGLGRAR